MRNNFHVVVYVVVLVNQVLCNYNHENNILFA